MNVTLRPGNAEDAQHCGAICYEAFKTIAEQHNFPPEFPSPEVVTEILARLLVHPDVYAVVAELDGRVVGSNFLHERSTVAGIGPINEISSLTQGVYREAPFSSVEMSSPLV